MAKTGTEGTTADTATSGDGSAEAGGTKAGTAKAGGTKAGTKAKTGDGKAGNGKAGNGKAGTDKAGKAGKGNAGTDKAGKGKAGNGKAGKAGKAASGAVTTGPGEVTAEVTTPDVATTPVVPSARSAPESRPLAVRHPRKPAPARSRPAADDEAESATSSEVAVPVAALPASSTVDELTRLALVPVDVARSVLPERRLPFYLGVGALTVVGFVEWPLALGASLAWEALRRRPAR